MGMGLGAPIGLMWKATRPLNLGLTSALGLSPVG